MGDLDRELEFQHVHIGRERDFVMGAADGNRSEICLDRHGRIVHYASMPKKNYCGTEKLPRVQMREHP